VLEVCLQHCNMLRQLLVGWRPWVPGHCASELAASRWCVVCQQWWAVAERTAGTSCCWNCSAGPVPKEATSTHRMVVKCVRQLAPGVCMAAATVHGRLTGCVLNVVDCSSPSGLMEGSIQCAVL
jgi:hypothetical protein